MGFAGRTFTLATILADLTFTFTFFYNNILLSYNNTTVTPDGKTTRATRVIAPNERKF